MNPSPQPSAAEIDDAIASAMRLSLVEGVGPITYARLVAQFGSPAAVLAAAPAELRAVEGIGVKLMRRITTADSIDVASELARCRDHGIALKVLNHDGYPRRLSEIVDPPPLLYVRGELLPRDELAIAIVGTRHASHYGVQQSERLARGLAQAGFTIVSGLARGVDAAVHRAALAAGGRTVAVLGCGLLNLYPPDHAELAEQIAQNGALVTESPTLQAPKSGVFPQRNRMISGLSLGVIVVEAAQQSGALITARHAMEQGRETFAVPGRVDNRMSRGCHALIRDGAKLVETIDDVLEELGPLPVPLRRADDQAMHWPAELNLNEQEQAVLQSVLQEPTTVDDMVARTGLPVQRVLATISVLESRRMIQRLAGPAFVRK